MPTATSTSTTAAPGGPLILGHAHPEVVEAIRDAAARGHHLRHRHRSRAGPRAPGLRPRAVDRDGALCQLRHRGDDVRPAPGPRLHAAATTSSSSRAATTATPTAFSSRPAPVSPPCRCRTVPACPKAFAAADPRRALQRLRCPRRGLRTPRQRARRRHRRARGREHGRRAAGAGLPDAPARPLHRSRHAPGLRRGRSPASASASAATRRLSGVMPDLTCLGKIIGGGLPVGAYGGRREIMELVAPSGPVYQAGHALRQPAGDGGRHRDAAACSSAPASTRRWTRRPRALAEGIAAAARRAGVPLRVNRVGSMMTLFFTRRRRSPITPPPGAPTRRASPPSSTPCSTAASTCRRRSSSRPSSRQPTPTRTSMPRLRPSKRRSSLRSPGRAPQGAIAGLSGGAAAREGAISPT